MSHGYESEKYDRAILPLFSEHARERISDEDKSTDLWEREPEFSLEHIIRSIQEFSEEEHGSEECHPDVCDKSRVRFLFSEWIEKKENKECRESVEECERKDRHERAYIRYFRIRSNAEPWCRFSVDLSSEKRSYIADNRWYHKRENHYIEECFFITIYISRQEEKYEEKSEDSTHEGDRIILHEKYLLPVCPDVFEVRTKFSPLSKDIKNPSKKKNRNRKQSDRDENIIVYPRSMCETI